MRHLTLIFGIILLLPSLSKAEDNDSFFGEGFKVQPESDAPEKKKADVKPKATPTAKDKSQEALKDTVRDIAQRARENKIPNVTVAKTGSVQPTGKQTIQVSEISAILDGSNQAALEQQVADMISVVNPKVSLLALVYVVGSSEKKLPLKLSYEIAMRGGTLRYVDWLPRKYSNIKLAPTWILTGVNQEIIIEGAGKLSENLSREGAIITRATEKVPLAAKTP